MRTVLSHFLLLCALLPATLSTHAQVDEDQLGAWYMYFWNTTIKNGPWGAQGDAQYRDYQLLGDLEQLLLRGGITYRPHTADVKFTLGYCHVTSGAFGESDITSSESRIYQEALLPNTLSPRFQLLHRFRYEQRFVEGQDMRTRFRYALFMNVPINRKDLDQGAIYLAFYNAVFINGEQKIGDGRTVQLFDRNRTYGGVGYSFSDALKVQFGYMRQVTNSIGKGQLQFSLHHKI